MSLGDGSAGGENNADTLNTVEQALQVSYDPHTTSQVRQEALRYLDDLIHSSQAPSYGYQLASNHSLPAHARHFGLQLLETCLIQQWDRHTAEEKDTMRGWIVSLAQCLKPGDPQYVRYKTATLWVKLVERIWPDTWDDLDANLQELWNAQGEASGMYRTFVLYILECLSEDICVRENPVAMLRSDALGQSLNEICITAELYEKHREDKKSAKQARHGEEGWLARICNILQVTVPASQLQSLSATSLLVLRCLDALKSIASWISLSAVHSSQCIDCVFQVLAYGDDAIRVASIELLLAIFSRTYNPHFAEIWSKLQSSILVESRLAMLRRIFDSAQTDPEDIDESKYIIQKKLAELLSVIVANDLVGSFREDRGLSQLMIHVFSSSSLLVSIPILHIISNAFAKQSDHIKVALRPASSVLMDHPILAYLREDFETFPELHAFLGNYRRYCTSVIEHVSRDRPLDAIEYLLGLIKGTFVQVQALTDSTYSKNAIPVAQLDANFWAVRGALRGYALWLQSQTGSSSADHSADAAKDQEIAQAADALNRQCTDLAAIDLVHPDVARVVLLLMVGLLAQVRSRASEDIIISVFRHVLAARPEGMPGNADHVEAMNIFEAQRLGQLERFTVEFPEQLYARREEFSALLDGFLSSDGGSDSRRHYWGYKFLPIVLILRPLPLEEGQIRVQLLSAFEPMSKAWKSPALQQGLVSFEQFCSLIGLEGVMPYLGDARYHSNEDWPGTSLDQRGLQLRDQMLARYDQLPLRITLALLNSSTANLQPDTPAKNVSSEFWHGSVHVVLPPMLALLRHATAFCNEESWSYLPVELQATIRRMMVDRFWQSGISNETKDEFTARVSGSSNSFEGFASTFRGSTRQIRDACYYFIHGLSRVEEAFFSITELGEPLAEALLHDAHHLSTHHLQRLVALLDRLVDRCPPRYRAAFLTPLLTMAYPCFHLKLTREWEAIEVLHSTATDGEGSDRLSEEMRAESVLRSTTHAFLTLTHKIVMPPLGSFLGHGELSWSLRSICVNQGTIIGPLISFLIAALSMRDSRSATIAAQTLRSLIPLFNGQTGDSAGHGVMHDASPEAAARAAQIRDELATRGLQAAIVSLNEQHFVDIQKELAALIAAIVGQFSRVTDAPARVLGSLQGMEPGRVEGAVRRIAEGRKEREQRAVVLELLEGIRGVRISEMGKIGVGDGGRAKKKSMARWMEGAAEGQAGIVRGATPPDGLAALFEQL